MLKKIIMRGLKLLFEYSRERRIKNSNITPSGFPANLKSLIVIMLKSPLNPTFLIMKA